MTMTYLENIQKLWKSSIRNQLIIGVALVHAVMMTFFIMDLVSREKSFLEQQKLNEARALAHALATNATSWLLANDLIGLEELVMSLTNYPHINYVMILDNNGKALAHNDRKQIGLYVSDQTSLDIFKGNAEANVRLLEGDITDASAPVRLGEKVIGWARIGITSGYLNNLLAVKRQGLLYTIFAIAIGTVIAWFLANRLTKGLHEMIEVIHRAKTGKRYELVKDAISRDDEVGELATAFNEMTMQLARDEQKLKRMTEDIGQVFDALPDPAYIIDNDFNLLQLNRAFIARLGFSDKKDILGMKCHAILQNNVSACKDCPYTITQSDKQFHYIIGGKRFGVSCNILSNPLFDEHHELRGAIIYIKPS